MTGSSGSFEVSTLDTPINHQNDACRPIGIFSIYSSRFATKLDLNQIDRMDVAPIFQKMIFFRIFNNIHGYPPAIHGHLEENVVLRVS